MIVEILFAFSSLALADSIILEVLSLGLNVEEDLCFQRKLAPKPSEDFFSSSRESLWQQDGGSCSGSSSTLKVNKVK